MGSRKTFNIGFSPPRFFEMVIDNFSVALSWFITVSIKKIKIVALMALLMNVVVTLKLKKIKFTIDNALVEILQNLPLTLSIKKIKFTSVMRLLEKWTQTLSIKKIKITSTMRQLLRLASSTLIIKKIKIIALATVAQFRVLSYYDPYMLSDWDSTNLIDMDYTIAP